MTWGTVIKKVVVAKIGLALMFFGAIGTAFCQNSNGEDSTASPQQELTGKSVFDLRCSICHGLDGLGGEHAPDIIRRTAVRKLSDQALLDLIHDGIPQAGMPAFPDMGQEDAHALIAYLRFLQGRSGGNSIAGDPARGREVFFGKARCAACHSRGQLIAEDLSGFARDHEVGEIREAILRPTGGRPEAATAVALDGRKFSGIVRNEDNASLQLQDGDGQFYLLMKSGLVSIQRTSGEAMPGDYGQRLNTSELNDLISYILREAGIADAPSPSGKNREPHEQD